MSQYKVLHISKLKEEGFDFETLTYMLLGKGPHIACEYDDEIGWFPLCGENRFKTKALAEEAIAYQIQMNEEMAQFKKDNPDLVNPTEFSMSLDKLVKALDVGQYSTAPSQLIQGAALVVEDLDVSGMGLYTQDQKDELVKSGVSEDDFFLAEESIGRWGVGYYMRKSDEGKKRHTFEDKELKLHKDLVKK